MAYRSQWTKFSGALPKALAVKAIMIVCVLEQPCSLSEKSLVRARAVSDRFADTPETSFPWNQLLLEWEKLRVAGF